MPVINSLAFQKTAEQLQIPLVPAFASSSSMYKNGMLFFTYLFYKTAYLVFWFLPIHGKIVGTLGSVE